MTIKLAIVRHGHTEWNRRGQIQGRTDIPLDDEARTGLAQMRLPEGWQSADLYASPLSRARETAELIALHAPTSVEPLIEMDWGQWEGKRGVDLKADLTSGFRDIESWGWDYRPPEGESPRDVWVRVAPWVQSLTRDSIAVCHIGTMRILLARAHGWGFRGPPPFRIKRNCLYVIEVESDCLRVGTPERVRLVQLEE